jgi:hypothetical protein
MSRQRHEAVKRSLILTPRTTAGVRFVDVDTMRERDDFLHDCMRMKPAVSTGGGIELSVNVSSPASRSMTGQG